VLRSPVGQKQIYAHGEYHRKLRAQGVADRRDKQVDDTGSLSSRDHIVRPIYTWRGGVLGSMCVGWRGINIT